MKNATKFLFGLVLIAATIALYDTVESATTGAPPRVVNVQKFEDLPDALLKENSSSIFAVNYGTTSGDGLGGLFVYSSTATNTVDARDVHLSYSGVGRLLRIGQGHPLQVGPDAASPKEYTISGGAITPTGTYFTIDTQGDAGSDDLDTITVTNYKPGDLLILQANNTARTVVLKDGTGNLRLSGDFSLDNTEDTATVMLIGTNWTQIATANNGS